MKSNQTPPYEPLFQAKSLATAPPPPVYNNPYSSSSSSSSSSWINYPYPNTPLQTQRNYSSSHFSSVIYNTNSSNSSTSWNNYPYSNNNRFPSHNQHHQTVSAGFAPPRLPTPQPPPLPKFVTKPLPSLSTFDNLVKNFDTSKTFDVDDFFN